MPAKQTLYVKCLAMLVALAAHSVRAQDSEETSLGRLVHEICDEEADRYTVTMPDGVALSRVPRSLLRWSKATQGSAFGDTYIWTHQGCAEAIVSIYAVTSKRIFDAEFQSLSDETFTMHRDGIPKWSPAKPGVEFRPIADIRPPTNSATTRLGQMNRIARQFRAEFSPHTAPDEISRLRLLSKPLYRYESTNEKILDGAVYGFVDSTDPELLLVIEARRTDAGSTWVYSPARSRHDQLRLYYRDELVWDVPRLAPPWGNIRNPDRPYFNLQLARLLPPDQWQRIQEAIDR
ncbi:hypothetical protein NZK35_09605 [Stieleria sp. ICT_E10.1]|uniref:hypothetical protein n=1 Tax=Stieleria sedimenti TaxID=2976331 RepID=UPI00217FC1BB|nr:hypothetical protein [Stieleria sedimenti]MCS7466899.1 hypothetical protein [Stieleria sedimenti]